MTAGEAVLLDLGDVRLRTLTEGDLPSMVEHANDDGVSRQLRDRFPHPYTMDDAQQFLAMSRGGDAAIYAIEVDAAVVGGIGLHPGHDVHRLSAELGYWIGRRYWGRGILSRIVPAFVPLVARELGMKRVYAYVYETNPASARVLEKSGFELEGRLRRSVVKRGEVLDQLLFAWLPPEPGAASESISHSPSSHTSRS